MALGFLLLTANPQPGSSQPLIGYASLNSLTAIIDLKLKLIGEIVGHSYIKMSIESTSNKKGYKDISIPVKGSYYEAVSSKTFKIIGNFNTKTLIWKLDCFDKGLHHSVFIGKENPEGVIEGHWTRKRFVRRFYLKRDN